MMRSVTALLIIGILLATGCAPGPRAVATSSSETAGAPTPEERQMDARADSLLALPPDQLSESDWEWLRFYEQRRAQRSQQETQEAAVQEVRRANNTWIILAGVGLALTVLTTVWAMQAADDLASSY